jgi:putative spermidine/putrescine transport system substrate-binding protein/spermidine/putrescine transport system substrate-binding protein
MKKKGNFRKQIVAGAALFIGALLLVGLFVTGISKAAKVTLSALVWEGYTDESFTKVFLEKYGAEVKGTYVGGMDEFFAKVKAGGAASYDLVALSSNLPKRMIDSDLVQPIDLKNVPNYNDIFEFFRKLDYNKKDGQVYGVNYTWGPDPVTYRTDVFTSCPPWDIFKDPKYKGKLSVPGEDNTAVFQAGILLGTDPYTMDKAKLEEAKKLLIQWRPQIRAFWSTAGELTNLIANKEVVASISWPIITLDLKKQGIPVAECIPDPGTSGWIDQWMVVKGTKNKDMAEKWINFAISPEGQYAVFKVTNYFIVNPKAAPLMTPDEKAFTHIDDPNYIVEASKKIKWWQPIQNEGEYNEVRQAFKTAK